MKSAKNLEIILRYLKKVQSQGIPRQRDAGCPGFVFTKGDFMKKTDILELKKRLKINKATFDRIAGCYVSTEKKKVLTFNKQFLSLEEEEQHKYLDIAKKVLSTKVGDQMLEHTFPISEEKADGIAKNLLWLAKNGINDNALLDGFYDHIIETYDSLDAYVILLFHDRYDIPNKNTDNLYDDTSDEVFNYILFTICPVKSSKSGLAYFEKENMLSVRIRDKILEAPTNGFIYPAFTDRSTDVHSIVFYTKKPKEPAADFWQEAFHVTPKKTTAEKQIKLENIVKAQISENDTAYIEIQEALKKYIEEKETSDTQSCKVLNDTELEKILVNGGIKEKDKAKQVIKQFTKSISEEKVTAEELFDEALLKKSTIILENKRLKLENQELRDRLKEMQNR